MTQINVFHPNSIYLNNNVKNFGSYFEEIKKEYPEKDYILWLNNDEIKNFLEYGFIECRRTYDVNIDINSLVNYFEEYSSNDNQVSRHSFVLSDNLIIKWYETYKQTHKVNPIKDFNLEEFKLSLSDNLDFENSIVILNQNLEIIAYALIYNVSDHTKEIGYVYFENYHSKMKLSKELLLHMHFLKDLGIKTIMTEIDNTDQYAYELFSSFIDNNISFMKTLIYKNEMKQFSTKTIEYNDLKYVLNWSKDKQFCLLNDWPLNRTKEEITEWWKSVIKLQSDTFKREMLVSNDIVVGYYDLYKYDNHTLELGMAIGDKAHRNKGYGSLLFSKITGETRKQYPEKNIIAITHETNIASRRMLIKSGYELKNQVKKHDYIEEEELLFEFV